MDLFLLISVLQAIFLWLGDLEKIICPWKERIVHVADAEENCHKSVMIRTLAFFFLLRFPHYLGAWNGLI